VCGRASSTKNSSQRPSDGTPPAESARLPKRRHRRDGRPLRNRRYGPPPALRPAELAGLAGHDTAPRSNRRWKALPSRYSASGSESRLRRRFLHNRAGWRSAMTSRPAVGRQHRRSRDRRSSPQVWTSCLAAAARAAFQLPYTAVTTPAEGQSPVLSRSSASPPRRRARVRDQSYDDGSRP